VEVIPECVARWKDLASPIALSYKLDPLLVLAIMFQESSGNPDAVGFDGHGKGLMQIDDRAWPAWFTRVGDGWKDPRTNVQKGCDIFSNAMRKLNQDSAGALCAYNAGLGTATRVQSTLPGDATLEQRVHAFDLHTYGHVYVSSVLAHRAQFEMP